MRENSVIRHQCQCLIMKSKPREFVAQDTEIPITGHCNTFPKVDIFCAAIILDILGDSLYSQ